MRDITIIGGGIVGLATAYHLKQQQPNLKVVLLEKENKLAAHQTGHNSGVIHSGIYYKPGSLKAKNCLSGYKMLLEFAKANDIAYELCGKIIVATREDELPAIENVYKRGVENGLQNLKKISKEQIRDFEPHCVGIAGIHVPQTGIIDYTQVSQKYAELFQKVDGEIYLSEKVEDLRFVDGHSEIITQNRTYKTKLIINCAGLFCDKVATLNDPKIDVRIIPFRGEYYELRPEKYYLVRNLIYPVPDPNFPFLGVHFTRMIGGGIEAGPNAVWAFKREGYKRTDFSLGDFWDAISWPGFRRVMWKYMGTGLGEMYRSWNKAAFTKALQRLIPELQKDDLVVGGSGIRAQACDRSGGLLDDFFIKESEHIINVLNAPSPAATSSLAIGKAVAEMALRRQ
ncbi:MAG: L-2-hydroxyglutarate oxidase [Flavobacteriaceae bacterium]|nr:L-2-hydroxyglutarate oxidase [Flavobacteriaceae bacterium]